MDRYNEWVCTSFQKVYNIPPAKKKKKKLEHYIWQSELTSQVPLWTVGSLRRLTQYAERFNVLVNDCHSSE